MSEVKNEIGAQNDWIKNKVLNPYKGSFYRQYGAKFSRNKKSYGILRLYQILIALDDYLLDRVERALRGEKIIFNLAPDYIMSMKWLIDAFEYNNWNVEASQLSNIHMNVLPQIKKIDNHIKADLGNFFKANEIGSTSTASISEVNKIWEDFVIQPFYKELVAEISKMIQLICATINLPITTDEKYNKTTHVFYSQFSIVPKPQQSTAEASDDLAEQIEFNKKLAQVKETLVKKDFVSEGLSVSRLRFGPYMLMVGSDPGEKETIVDTETGETRVQNKIKKIYCDQFADKGCFESMNELKAYATEYNTKYNALRSLVHNPKIVPSQVEIETIDEKTGLAKKEYKYQTSFKDANGRILGKFLNTEIQYTQIQAKPGIRGQGIKTNKIIHQVSRLDEEAMSHVYGDVKVREISDVDRDNKFTRYSLKRNIETQMIKDSVGRERIVITTGKYRGYFLEDIVNVEGRMIEGSSYTFNLKGRVNKYESIVNGELKVENLEEPYITISQDADCKSATTNEDKIAKCRFYLGIPYIPGKTNMFKAERDSMFQLSKKMSDVQLIPDTNRQFWTFGLSSYESVRTALGSCALSASASSLLDIYYKDLLKKEYALKEDNVKLYSAERIGGFKAKLANNADFKLNNKQMEALAWLDANNFTGLMALDTGVGKTLLATAAIMLAKKKEKESGEKTERKFLFVQPKALVGNLVQKSVNIFCENPDEVAKRIVEISYDDFMDTWYKGKKAENSSWSMAKGNAQVTEKYGEAEFYAVFFDEINYATKGDKGRAVSGLKHSRKVLLTGSAIEKDPTDLFKFVALTKGLDISKPAEQNKFVRKYANVVGGRFVGVKPEVKGEFDTWVRTNAYFADKQQVEYEKVGQPKLLKPISNSHTVVMPTALQTLYSKKAEQIESSIKQMLAIYSQSASERGAINDENKKLLKDLAQGSLAKEIKFLHDLSANPKRALARISDAELAKYKVSKKQILEEGNPKLNASIQLAKEQDKKGTKSLYFTDDNNLAIENAMELASNLPSAHVVCLLNEIRVYRNGELKRIFTSKNPTADKAEQDRIFRNAAKKEVLVEKTPEQLEEETKWAQSVLKDIIIANIVDVKTMTCTAPFARGFNFQEFTTVIHLDRNGWSSEEMKQRTARSYRQGQSKQVEELFIDMVYANDKESVEKAVALIGAGKEAELSEGWKKLLFLKSGLRPAIEEYRFDTANLTTYLQGILLKEKGEKATSIDELKGLVQGKDQEFFNAIIKDAMGLNLLQSYESIQRDTSKSIGTSARLLMRAVNPTEQNVQNIQNAQSGADKAPLYYDTALDDKRFNKVNLKGISTPLNSADVLDMAGIGEILNVSNKHSSKAVSLPSVSNALMSNEITITQVSEDTLVNNLKVRIKHDGSKPVSVEIDTLNFKNCAPPDMFASTILSMIKSAVMSGAKTVSINAKANEVSAYVKLGFDANIPVSLVKTLTTTASSNADIAKIFADLVKEADNNKADILKLGLSSLFKKKSGGIKGSDVWKLAPVALNLTLDLNNDTSIEPLMMYFKTKAKQAGINYSEFFTKNDIPPFHTQSAKCWIGFLSGGFDSHVDMPKEAIVKKYLTDLKKVIISNPAEAPTIVRMVGMTAPGIAKQLQTIISRLNSTPDLESKVKFVEETMDKKASLKKKANIFDDLDNDPILNEVWDTLIEFDQAKFTQADIALEEGNFLASDILKP